MNITFTSLLFLLFLGLKLTGYITWSWIWIAAPLWIPLCFTLAVLAFCGLVVCLTNKGDYAKKI